MYTPVDKVYQLDSLEQGITLQFEPSCPAIMIQASAGVKIYIDGERVPWEFTPPVLLTLSKSKRVRVEGSSPDDSITYQAMCVF